MTEREQGPSGIGGWLLVYLLTVAIFRPAIALARVYLVVEANPRAATAFGQAYQQIRVGEWTIVGVDVAICFFVAWRLVCVRSWASVRIAIAGMWASVVVVLLAEPMMVSLATGAPMSRFFSVSLAGLLRGVGYAAFWTTYLLRSRRVENTYPFSPARSGLSDVFG